MAAAATLVAAPVLGSCSSRDDSVATADLGGAELDAILRGSFVPALDTITLDLVDRWQEGRNASIVVDISEEWRLLTASTAQAARGADIGELFGNQPHLLSEQLVDVSDLAERAGEALGGWSNDARDICMVNGVWRAVPWSTTRHGMVVRTDYLDDMGAGLPDTYDDLLGVAVGLREAGLPPVGFTMSEVAPSDAAAFAYGMLWSFGGQELSEAGRVALRSDATRSALEYFAELSAVGLQDAFEFTHPDNNDAYLASEIAITQNPSSIYLRARQDDPALADVTTHHPLPAGPAGQFQLPEIDSLAVFRHSPDPVAAMDWIEFVATAPVMVERAAESLAFHLPPVLGLDDDPAMPWHSDERLLGLSSTVAEGRMPGWPLPPSREAGLVYDNHSIIKMFKAVGTGQMPPDEAMATAADELVRVYET